MTGTGKCPICGGRLSAPAGGLLKCGVCGLVLREDRYYGEPVYASGLEDEIYGSSRINIFDSALASLQKARPGLGRLLDIGCAYGMFLKTAAGRGWRAEGVELSAKLAAKASAAGFRVYRSPVETAGLEAAGYDAVTVFEVFSLMERPAEAAAEMFRIMKPGGVILVREFNAAFHLPLHKLSELGFFSCLGLNPSILHNYNFTGRALRSILEGAGFRGIKIRNSPPTKGDPYRTGGRLGPVFTGVLKVLYYTLAQALWLATLGRVYAGSALIVTARKPE